MVDRNRALKLEDSVGGSTLDWGPTETAPNSDGLDARAYFVQNGTSADSTTFLSRSGTNLTLTDGNATRILGELVSKTLGQSTAHQSLADIIHFLCDGPGDGWTSGAYQTAGYSGPLLTSTVWWTSAAQTQRIYAVFYTYQGPLVATATYTLYDKQGTQARQVIDTFAYQGPSLTSVTRTWS